MSTATYPVIADRLWAPPSARTKSIARSAALVVGFTLLTAALAQFEIHLGFTPVPITGQTLGVLLAGGALGWQLGAASMSLYWVAGLIGLPFYAGGDGGWSAGTGATMGYLVGFIVAAGLIGYLAERRHDRNLATSLAAMALGSAVIYVLGALWMAHILNIPIDGGEANAIAYGVSPFLIGDALKLAIAGALLPAAWSIADRTPKR